MRLCAAILTGLALAFAGPSTRAAVQDAPASDGGGSSAPTAAPFIADRTNAATLYRRAAEKCRDIDRRITEAQWMAVYEFEGDTSRGPTPEVRQTLRKLQPAISLTLSAARREFSGFGIDYAAAAEASRYQHFADMRTLIRMLGYDFSVRIEDQDARSVCEYLQAMYRMGAHAAAENVVLGSLVGSALVAFADTRLASAFDHAMIGPAEATLLLRELDRFKGDDPLGYAAALAHEQALLVDSMTRRFSGEEGLALFRAEMSQWVGDDAQAAAALDGLTAENLQALLASYAGAAGRVNAAFADADHVRGDAAMAEVKREFEEGPFAPLMAAFIALDGPRLRDLMQRSRKMLDDRRETLGQIASGEIDPMSLANAAVWYIRATREIENIDPMKRSAIDAYAVKYDVPADAALTAIFNRHDMQSVVAVLRTAANLSRCDWTYANLGSDVVMPYHAGLLWCGRLLTADAARLLHEQKYDDAAIRMAMGYRLSSDLATDGAVAGALGSHRIFNDIDALASAAIDARMLNEDQIAMLAAQVANFARGDPFHYQPAIATMRTSMGHMMLYFVQGAPTKTIPEATKEQRDRAAAILDGLDADCLLALEVMYEHWEKTRQKPKAEAILARGGLETIMDMQAMRAAADLAPVLTEWIRSGQMEQVRTAELPVIAPLSQRTKQSLADFRKAVLRYEGESRR